MTLVYELYLVHKTISAEMIGSNRLVKTGMVRINIECYGDDWRQADGKVIQE